FRSFSLASLLSFLGFAGLLSLLGLGLLSPAGVLGRFGLTSFLSRLALAGLLSLLCCGLLGLLAFLCPLDLFWLARLCGGFSHRAALSKMGSRRSAIKTAKAGSCPGRAYSMVRYQPGAASARLRAQVRAASASQPNTENTSGLRSRLYSSAS